MSNKSGNAGDKTPALCVGQTVLVWDPSDQNKKIPGLIVDEQYPGSHPDFNHYYVYVKGKIIKYTGIRIKNIQDLPI